MVRVPWAIAHGGHAGAANRTDMKRPNLDEDRFNAAGAMPLFMEDLGSWRTFRAPVGTNDDAPIETAGVYAEDGRLLSKQTGGAAPIPQPQKESLLRSLWSYTDPTSTKELQK